MLIIGGGLAGLAAGCYAQRNGIATTIIEHNLALGGVCTAWQRGPYLVDGCIHWLTGGPFTALYEELDILPALPLRTIHTWVGYHHARDELDVAVTCDLEALATCLTDISPEDAEEMRRLVDAARRFVTLRPEVDAPELGSVRDRLRAAWEMRGALGTLVHFREPIGRWAVTHVKSPRLRRFFTSLLPETTPALFLLMVLGYLEKGYLSRPIGGTAAFRDALEKTYRDLGGQVRLHATADEVLVRGDRACGVRLADGTILEGDLVLSTSSAPETVLRLLGGRYDAGPTRERLERWKLFDPVVLASFGVARGYDGMPAIRIIDGIEPFSIGNVANDRLHVRVYNDDASFAPPGHTVVQAMLTTDYDHWATRGTRYGAEKDAVAEAAITQLEPHFPGFRDAVRMIDVATPLTYWAQTRSWRGAYEGWMPSADAFFGHIGKKLAGLDGLYMAGQWVEPGGGVPTAVMSGRQAIQLVCSDLGRPFVARPSRHL